MLGIGIGLTSRPAVRGAAFTPLADPSLQDYLDGRDLSDGAVASWASRKFSRAYTEATNQPTAASGIVTFDGTNDIISAARPPLGSAVAVSLPDGLGGDVGKGFTCTGLAALPDGTWLVGNDGRNVDGDVTYQSSIVRLSNDFATKLGEVAAATIWPGILSIQGIARDASDGSFWLADYGQGAIRHFTIDITSGLSVTATAGDITGLTNPNGVGYRTNGDEIIVGTESSSNFTRYNASTGASIGTLSSGLGNTNRDQIAIDNVNDVLAWTAAANGVPGVIYAMRMTGAVSTSVFDVAEADAVEGLAFVGSTMYVLSDGYFHAQPSALNRALRYSYAPFYSGVVDLWGAVKLGAGVGTGAISDAILVNGIPTAGQGVGVYAASTTSLVVIVNTGASGTTEQNVLTATGLPDLSAGFFIFYARVDKPGNAITLWVNNGAPQTTTCGNLAALMMVTRGSRIGGANTGETSAASRFCPMDVKALGISVGGGNRAAITSYLAAQFGITIS